jgi:hypothetical protein
MSRNTPTPPVKKANWFKQIWQAFQVTRDTDPAVTWWVLGPLVGIILISVAVGLITGSMWMPLFFGIPFALVVAMLILVRRAEAAAYKRIDGQPGAAMSAAGTVRTGQWTWEQEPVAVNPKTGEMIFRGVGRGGVVLLSEGGSANRAARLADSEAKKVKRVVAEAPVSVIRVGSDGDVELRKLSRHLTRMKPVLSKQETGDVTRRLKTLSARQPLPIPKGVDPNNVRPDRKGMRGR